MKSKSIQRLLVLVLGIVLFFLYPFLSRTVFPFLMKVLWAINNLAEKNPFLQAFLYGSIGGYTLFVLRSIFHQIYSTLLDSVATVVTVHSSDPNYNAIIDFVTMHYLQSTNTFLSTMQVQTKKKTQIWKDWYKEYLGTAKRDPPELELRPNDDGVVHTLKYKGQTIIFSRVKGETYCVGYEKTPTTLDSLSLTMWGTDKSVLLELIQEAVQQSVQKEDDGITIYVLSQYLWWEKALTKKPRSLASVIFDVDDAENVISDARNFLRSSAWYDKMGIPYRRGYLLYGPPGEECTLT